MRLYWDECCYGWRHDDNTFEPYAMPIEWFRDYRGQQIEYDRHRFHNYSGRHNYLADAKSPTHEEKFGHLMTCTG